MNKQKYLDQTPESAEMKATQEILRVMNKTQVLKALTSIKVLDNALYTTSLKELPFLKIYESLIAAGLIYKSDENGADKMED